MGASGTQCAAGIPGGGGGNTAPNGGSPVGGGSPGGSTGNPGDPGSATAATALPTSHRRSASDNRRSNKPIMEKRRRARINNCLNELKTLILDATKKDPARHSKLEKADILEMTVRHLETLRRQRAALSAAADPSVIDKYKAGFSECAAEVSRFLMRQADASSEAATDQHLKRRLLSHLTHCLNSVSSTDEASSSSSDPMDDSPPPHALPPLAPKQSPSDALFAAAGLQLVPTRLPNGDIALVLPSRLADTRTQQRTPPSTTPSSSPPPLVLSFPSRTASTASCSSSSSSASPVAFDGPTAFALAVPSLTPTKVRATKSLAVVAGCATEGSLFGCTLGPEPLSLVTRMGVAEECREEDGPWRPW